MLLKMEFQSLKHPSEVFVKSFNELLKPVEGNQADSFKAITTNTKSKKSEKSEILEILEELFKSRCNFQPTST
jgi:hypothetical protein